MSAQERLEYIRVAPGVWVIEGRNVVRLRLRVQQSNRRGSRWEYRWLITSLDREPVYTRTLAEAFDLIADEVIDR